MTEAEKAQAIYAARREEQMERNHRDALVLAEKLLDRAAELGATTDEFEEAVRYIQAFRTDKGTLAKLDMRGMLYCPNCGARMDGAAE